MPVRVQQAPGQILGAVRTMGLIFKICTAELWRDAERTGEFGGAPVDVRDGFIHFSTAAQLAETAAKHFRGQSDLLLLAVDREALGDALRFEPSRGGDLFPHLYGTLPVSAVRAVHALPLLPDGLHLLPDLAAMDVAPTRFDPGAMGWKARDEMGLMALLGPIWTRREGEDRIFAFLADARHLNRNGMVHGGMLMAFADQALGIVAGKANGGRRQVTVQLDTHFVGAVREGDFVEARCTVVRQTRSLLFMTGTLTVEGQIVSTSRGVWKVLGA